MNMFRGNLGTWAEVTDQGATETIVITIEWMDTSCLKNRSCIEKTTRNELYHEIIESSLEFNERTR